MPAPRPHKPGRQYRGKRRVQNYYRGARQLAKDVMILKSLVNVEKKFIDTATSGTTLQTNTTGTVVPINTCSQGTSLTTRTGGSIKMAYVFVEGFVTLNAAALQDYIRVSLVLDKQVNAALPVYGDIYGIVTAPAPLSLRSPITVDRYIVLKEQKIGIETGGNTIAKFKLFKKLDIHTKYNAVNGGTIADIVTNALYLTFAGNLSSNFSTITYNCRVRFIDN